MDTVKHLQIRFAVEKQVVITSLAAAVVGGEAQCRATRDFPCEYDGVHHKDLVKWENQP